MAMYRKLGKASSPRKAMLRSLTTAVLEHGKVFTTEARAKEVRKQVEKLIALAVREKDNYEMVAVKAKVAKKDADGKRVKEEGLENDLLERIVKDDALYQRMSAELRKFMKERKISLIEILNYERFGKNYLVSLPIKKKVYYLLYFLRQEWLLRKILK